MTKKEIQEKKAMLELEHKLKMERLVYERQSAKMFHEQTLERDRNKSEAIKESQKRKEEGFRF